MCAMACMPVLITNWFWTCHSTSASHVLGCSGGHVNAARALRYLLGNHAAAAAPPPSPPLPLDGVGEACCSPS